jgi:hypothetical protein
VALAAAAESASKQEINAALLDYVNELTELTTEQIETIKKNKDNIADDVNKNIPDLIKIAKSESTIARNTEMNEYSIIKNSLGDVMNLVVSSSPNFRTTPKYNKENAQVINSINNATQIVLTFVLAILMIVCSNEVIFIISVGASVLLFPFVVHSVLGMLGTPIQAGFRWRSSVGRILMLIGGAMALYWTLSLIGSLFS